MPTSSVVPSPRDIRSAVKRAESGTPITPADAEILLSARGDELERVLDIASRMRDEGLERSGRAGIITYSKKVFIPITFLCRDRCHYCTFVETPGGLLAQGKPTFLSPDEILDIAKAGAAMGCKEALFTLGDRPEERWAPARKWLEAHGYSSTLDYVRAMAIRVLDETGLLPHLNPGVMFWNELQSLRPTAPSMGMMLETTATRLWSEKGGVHYGSPDKDPALRLKVLDDAGRAKIPFTSGVLLGIGENNFERAEALFAIRASHDKYGHIQETIVQNFRAKERTAMQNEDDLALKEYIAAVAVARLVMGADATIQAPPNLTDATELGLLIRAGIDDWGGVSPLTADHVNPERPWPELDDLAALTREAGFTLRERLTAHPNYVNNPTEWVDARIRPHLAALANPAGLAQEDAPVVGRSYSGAFAAALERATANPSGLSDEDYITLLQADGAELDELTTLADRVRHDTVGDDITFVVNRNIDASGYVAQAPGSAPQAPGLDAAVAGEETSAPLLQLTPNMLVDLAAEATELGATELCIQGALAPQLPGTAYLDIVATLHAAQPALHLHAFRPTEISDGAARLGLSVADFLQALREAGVSTVPGTGARILDDSIRAVLSGYTDPPASEWVSNITAAHRAGLRSTASMVFGHIETAAQQVAHLRTLASIQDSTGGFTEFIPMPFVKADAPPSVAAAVTAAGTRGTAEREARAVTAVARLMLHGRINNIQVAWTKLGMVASRAALAGGANDIGGLLLDGTIWPEAGPEAHRTLTRADVEQVAVALGRTVRQRTTDYGVPAALVSVG